MAVKGGFVAVPLPAVSAFPRWPCRSSAASPRENTPWKTLCPCAESRSNAEPLPHCPLPRNQARCVCTCAHAKFQPEESFIPDFYTLLPVGHTKSVPTETPVKRATPLPLVPAAEPRGGWGSREGLGVPGGFGGTWVVPMMAMGTPCWV